MQYETHVRADSTCPVCHGRKDHGLLVCWPCHRELKRQHHGGYGDKAEQAIAARESYLRGSHR
jgi:hypothetical protein